MKFGNLEGSPEEIKDFYQNNGLNVFDYLEKPESPLATIWLVIPSLISVGTLILIILLTPLKREVLLILFILGASFSCWLATSVQIRFKSPWATGVIGIAFFLMLLIAAGFIAPNEALDYIQKLKSK